MNDRERLEAIVKVVRQYLPPDGISIKEAMGKIIELVDPMDEDKYWGKLSEEHLQALKKDMRAKAERYVPKLPTHNSNLRKAAEMGLEALEEAASCVQHSYLPDSMGHDWDEQIEALRQALAEEALDRMVAENQRLGLYDDLQTAIERGTKAWADVPDGWVEELRGNDTPEVTPQVTTEVTTEVPCKTHPDAPHGFDRNASHSADRYVCECEGWEPVDKAYTKLDTTAGVLHKEWVGLTEEEIFQAYKPEMEGMPFNKPTLAVIAGYIEAKLKEKNT